MIKVDARSAVAAAILAVLTLSVFYVLQDYGPASAIRRFHAALVANDLNAMQPVVDGKVTDPTVTSSIDLIAQVVQPLLAGGVQPQVARMDHRPGGDDVAVVYGLPNGEKIAVIWIVNKKNAIWKVDPVETATALKSSLMR